jgi:hypothetical protein
MVSKQTKNERSIVAKYIKHYLSVDPFFISGCHVANIGNSSNVRDGKCNQARIIL